MTVMSVREFNASVSRAIAMVEAGGTVDISKNGKIVAELRPKRIERDAAWHAAVDQINAILDKGFALGGGPLTEDDIYGDAAL